VFASSFHGTVPGSSRYQRPVNGGPIYRPQLFRYLTLVSIRALPDINASTKYEPHDPSFLHGC